MKIHDKLEKLVDNQSGLSRKTGIAQSAISEAISGKRRLYADQLFSIARALGVTADFLLDDAQDDPPRPEALSASEQAAVDIIRANGLGKDEVIRRLTFQPGRFRLLTPEEEEELKRDRK